MDRCHRRALRMVPCTKPLVDDLVAFFVPDFCWAKILQETLISPFFAGSIETRRVSGFPMVFSAENPAGTASPELSLIGLSSARRMIRKRIRRMIRRMPAGVILCQMLSLCACVAGRCCFLTLASSLLLLFWCLGIVWEYFYGGKMMCKN